MIIANPLAHFQQGAANALAGGQQMQQIREQREEMARQEEMRNFLAQNGGALMSGDQNALARFAQYDPTGAFNMGRQVRQDAREDTRLGFEETRLGLDQEAARRQQEAHTQGMTFDRERLEQMRAEGRRAAETHASNMSEIERQREAQEIDRAVGAASMAWGQGPEAFEAWKQQNADMLAAAEMDPASVTYEDFPHIAAGLIGAKEALEDLEAGRSLNAGPSPQSPEGKLAADIRAGLVDPSAAAPSTSRIVTGQEAASFGLDPKKSYNVTTGADGTKATAIGGGGVSVTVGGEGEPSDGELRKTLMKSEGELWGSYLTAGNNSAGTAQDMELLGQLIEFAPQGPIEGNLARMFPGVSSAGAAFTSVVSRVAPTLKVPGSGATSDIEYEGMLASLPKLGNQPEANRAIAAMMSAKAQINMDRAEVVSQYQNGLIDAPTARQAINEIDRRSIMTPEMRRLFADLSDGAEEAMSRADALRILMEEGE